MSSPTAPTPDQCPACTVFGATGFIGSRLVSRLRADGHDVLTPGRGDRSVLDADLGQVFYAAGVTGDFRTRPRDTINAHASLLADLVERANFTDLVYLSSTRLYRHADGGDEECTVRIRPGCSGDLYDLSKLTGEAVCHHANERGASIRIARLAHVYGPSFDGPNFLDRIVNDAIDRGRITLETSPESTRNFVAIEDVVDMTVRLATAGRETTYNVAAPPPVKHGAIVEAIAAVTGCAVSILPNAPTVTEPAVAIGRVQAEFGFAPRALLEDLPALVKTRLRAAAMA